VDDGETVMIGDFDRELNTDLFRMLIARPLSADSTSLERLMTNASHFDQELKVFRYGSKPSNSAILSNQKESLLSLRTRLSPCH
jgi:hypothetical protein